MRIRESILFKKAYGFVSILARKRTDTYSAAAAFYIFMSFIPFTLILLSTVRYLPFSKEDLLVALNGVLPLEMNGIVTYVIDELYRHGIGVLSISIIAAIWASGKGVLGITKGLNEIHDVESGGNFLYLRTRSAVCTLLLMIGMILMFVISVFGNTITRIINNHIEIPERISRLIAASDLIMWLVLFLVYMFLFCVLPAKKITVRSQIPGAAGASFVWIMFTKLFSFYLSTFNGYSTYGSLAFILVMGIWLYTGMYIMFMGALANKLASARKG
ncbi:MAG: YihY/virulence factor BrkB family protein [Lachnospiraceae bacterium]|nr:YihY/virulence factor BrkB family protein [Lachnospiraceae bacterium]